jgi:hypothetical protein
VEQKIQNIWHGVSSAFLPSSRFISVLPLLLFTSLVIPACRTQHVTVDSVSLYQPAVIEIPVQEPAQESCAGARGEQQEPEVVVTGQAFNSTQHDCI